PSPEAVPAGADEQPAADPAERLLAALELPEDVRLPAPGGAPDDADSAPVPLVSYAPFYGGPYMPVAVVDRRRTRVTS
ncbi:DMT family transporter, partial [Streptomyces sp. NPDC005009]